MGLDLDTTIERLREQYRTELLKAKTLQDLETVRKLTEKNRDAALKKSKKALRVLAVARMATGAKGLLDTFQVGLDQMLTEEYARRKLELEGVTSNAT